MLCGSQEEKKKELAVELKVMETKARKRSLGNIRFIGELFKLKVSLGFCPCTVEPSNLDTNGTEEVSSFQGLKSDVIMM